MPVTATDVARRAGVSQSAVSRVFTPGASVSPAMAEKVRKAADELGYRPNVLARAMITGRSRIIGLVVAYLDNQFYPDAIERLSRSLQEEGYHVLLFIAPNDGADIDGMIGEMLSYQLDGLVMASVAMSHDLARRCEGAGIPVVLFNRGQAGGVHSTVTSANVAGGRRVAEFLVACGHRRIAHVAGWQGSSTGQERTAGFLAGLAEAGLPCTGQIDGLYTREGAAEATRRLFDTAEKPDALFVGNDHMAFAVIDVLRFELGLRVPQDVAVVGYDDTALAAWPAYDLTTVRQPVNRMVEATVTALLARIEGRDPAPRRIEIEGELIERGSTLRPERPE
ncbi:LacI family DNA-binding transcriptional regulator [Pontivivens ytuae]|uniref:LacI family DNA-binding transcriptional regulator n=1 Tax=Pontivivens ytuae TaxID=2789856 RepID=A0A7S9QBZ1_9RHOB|nr:LacI family DNA-binding transcriptional regulator [Pontivivens ytuae]QPH53673.1 LacI family DNA-binding transcriptional regulator [Pontivivens ytuae]